MRARVCETERERERETAKELQNMKKQQRGLMNDIAYALFFLYKSQMLIGNNFHFVFNYLNYLVCFNFILLFLKNTHTYVYTSLDGYVYIGAQ